MKTGAKVALGLGLGTGLGVLGYKIYTWLKKPPVTEVCTPGDTKCIGSDLCVCSAAGQWEVSVKDASQCQAPINTAILYGQVTDAKTGGPIEGIQVSCNSYTGPTGADGQYRIENITPGDYSVTFTDPLGRYETKVI
jgi:hypothetical protein